MKTKFTLYETIQSTLKVFTISPPPLPTTFPLSFSNFPLSFFLSISYMYLRLINPHTYSLG